MTMLGSSTDLIRLQPQQAQPSGLKEYNLLTGSDALTFAGHAQPLDQVRLNRLKFGRLTFNPQKSAMAEMQKRGVLVVGANGLMGSAILQNARQGLFNAYAMEMDPLDAKKAIETTTQKISAAKGKFISEAQYKTIMRDCKAEALSLKTADGQPAKLPPAGIVIEAIVESLSAKKALFKNLENMLPADTIFATNTSSLSVDDIAEGMQHPERVIGLHYFMPAVTNQLVEIIPGRKTDPAVVEKVKKFAEAIGKVPYVVTKDSPAFVANRLLLTVMAAEAMHLYEDGWGDAKTIDKVANRLFWPMAADIPALKDILLPPFAFIPKYGKLGVDIAKNFGRMGEYYKPSSILLNEHERVQGVLAGMADERRALQEIKRAYEQVMTQILEHQGSQVKGKPDETYQRLEEERKALDAEVTELERKMADRMREAQYFPNGLPTPPNLRSEPLEVRQKVIEQRLIGAYHVAMRQMVAEGLTTFDDVDNMAALGFKWKMKPRSPEEIEAAVNAMRKRYGDQLPIPDLKDPGRKWIKVSPVSRDGVMTITLNRVQDLMGKENFHTLGTPTLKAIKAAVEEANADPKVKTIVFAANGGTIFSGGANLDEVRGNTDLGQMAAMVQLGRETMDTIANSPKVTIAKVNGGTYGGGVELALACDYILASDQASFALPEINWGIVPAWGGTERLPQKVGKPMAKALILNGKTKIGVLSEYDKKFPMVRTIVNNVLRWDMDTSGYGLDAKTAQELGLVQMVVPHALLNDAVEQVLQNGAQLSKPDPRRGLSTFKAPEDYPEALRRKYKLDTIEADTRRRVGAFSRAAWAMANGLIDKSDTPEAGHFNPAELKAIVRDAAAKNEKLEELIATQVTYAKGDKKKSYAELALALLVNRQLIPGALKNMTGR